ncbi:hypothetical protein FHR32_000421 [Streptosporangium album]|uniref:Transketolase-like pyrimidine-binding domain-containing protein n=1 Tax=Streptosporangium album TaxID=47479 RepID=A0A7W7RR99_9ACTN|nr:hypothetical protein [Streptosporangium album]MBB4936116.1 hypothetical protein [Streptosporangium album]
MFPEPFARLDRERRDLMEADSQLHVLGEDICDPYGGAFKVTRGLSTRFGARVRSTPLSEGAITGVGAGLALAGDRAIVEIMFADFVALGRPCLFFEDKVLYTRRMYEGGVVDDLFRYEIDGDVARFRQTALNGTFREPTWRAAPSWSPCTPTPR